MNADKPMTDADVLRTVITLALACLAAFALFRRGWLLAAAAVLLAVGLAWMRLARLIARGWMRLGLLLGHLNARVILGVTFYLVLTPLAVLYRLFRRERVDRVFRRRRDTYFDDAAPFRGPESFEKPW